MKIKVRVPAKVAQLAGTMGDWLNVPLPEFRRIDAVLLVLGLFCTAYYGYSNGWIGALQGAIAFVFTVGLAFFLRAIFADEP